MRIVWLSVYIFSFQNFSIKPFAQPAYPTGKPSTAVSGDVDNGLPSSQQWEGRTIATHKFRLVEFAAYIEFSQDDVVSRSFNRLYSSWYFCSMNFYHRKITIGLLIAWHLFIVNGYTLFHCIFTLLFFEWHNLIQYRVYSYFPVHKTSFCSHRRKTIIYRSTTRGMYYSTFFFYFNQINFPFYICLWYMWYQCFYY